MRFLNQFINFNWDEFAEGKTFVVIGTSEYQDYDTKTHLGSKVECVIASDDTNYKNKNGEKYSNIYEKITFKVSRDVNVPLKSRIKPINAVATIYGDYRNQLSVKCDDILTIPPSKEK